MRNSMTNGVNATFNNISGINVAVGCYVYGYM